MKRLPRKGIVKLTNLVNASFRLKYVPGVWKMAEIIMIPKPGKDPNTAKSYRPISLLPIISKLFEKLFLKRLKVIIERKKLIQDHQFGFCKKHSTIDQVHRITDVIEKAYEGKYICSALFLDVSQAFDKVWHEGLIRKLEKIVPSPYVELLTSYLENRYFRVKHEGEYSDMKQISAGVPQGSVLGPVLYLLYTYDLPKMDNVKTATFADNTALLAVGTTIEEATQKLQHATDHISQWTKKWRVKLNELKSVNVNFTNIIIQNNVPIVINDTIVPIENTAKYLGMNLDVKLRWKEHVKKKRKELDLKYKKMYCLIGRKSKLSIHNKLLIYKQVLKPVWTYGLQLWGCARTTNIEPIQKFQNKVLRSIVDAPWYVRNADLHRDLKIPTIKEEIQRYAQKHEARLHSHENVEILQLLDNRENIRRLKRIKPSDLV